MANPNPKSSSKPKLYALLIGINAYPHSNNPLFGCHNDVAKMQQYLEEQDHHFDLQIATLLDDQATKAGIVAQFRSHFKSAQAKDTLLFYFSGHGCQEKADPELWPQETDQKLEGLVCYPTESREEVQKRGKIKNSVLVDKELRYLIWELNSRFPKGKGPHLVVIADCCHSGDNTRAAMDDAKVVHVRQEPFIAETRALSDFIFPKEWLQLKEGQDDLSGEDYLEGAHIQMGACQSHQLAQETILGDKIEISGVFTHYLLHFLRQNGGNLSYYDLRYRLKIYTRLAFGQVPQVYAPPKASKLYHAGFLNQPVSATRPFIAKLNHVPELGWVLNLGALQSVSRRSAIGVKVGNNTIIGKPKEVQPDLSIIEFAPADEKKLQPDNTYLCTVKGLMCEPINVRIDATIAHQDKVESLKEVLLKKVKGLNFVETTSPETYTLHLINGEYRLSQDGNPYRPMLLPIAIHLDGAIEQLGQYLIQIAQWEYVKGLQSESSERKVFDEHMPLTFNVQIQDENGTYGPRFSPVNDLLVLPVAQKNTNKKRKTRVFLRNTYNRALWVCPVYLDTDFTIKPIFKDRIRRMEADQEILLLDAGFSLKNHFNDYNWARDLSMLKFIVSTQENLDINPLLLVQGLPLPVTLIMNRDTKGFELGFEDDISEEHGWITQQLNVELPNPTYNRISKYKLEKMLAHPILQEYAEQIYLDPKSTPDKPELKAGISWEEQLES